MSFGDPLADARSDDAHDDRLGRHHRTIADLWSYGNGGGRGDGTRAARMGIDWPASQELIRRSLAEARAVTA